MVKEDMAEVEVTEDDTVDKKQLEKENPLWRPLKGKAERRRRRRNRSSIANIKYEPGGGIRCLPLGWLSPP